MKNLPWHVPSASQVGGYKGFTFYTGLDVSLEDDLKRRDLTVNAIAWSPSRGFVDPLSGMQDIADRVLRHVGDAFIEDPVRLLRLARFAARFADFSIAADTLALARRLVNDGEVDALVPERVWRELAKGLMTEHPERMIDVLQHTGAAESDARFWYSVQHSRPRNFRWLLQAMCHWRGALPYLVVCQKTQMPSPGMYEHLQNVLIRRVCYRCLLPLWNSTALPS